MLHNIVLKKYNLFLKSTLHLPQYMLEWHCKLNKLTKQNTEFSKEKKK